MGAVMTSRLRLIAVAVMAAYVGLLLALPLHAQKQDTLLKVSYDFAHEIFVGISATLARQHEAKAGQDR